MVKPGTTVEGYSMPSAHAQTTVTVWGMIALRVKQWWVTIFAIIFSILMMVSRVGLGVHYPSDVVVGALLGLLWLGVYWRFDLAITGWLSKKSLSALIGLNVLLVVVVSVIFIVAQVVSAPEELEMLLVGIGLLFGFGIGVSIEGKKVGFKVTTDWKMIVLRLVIGLVGLTMFRWITKSLQLNFFPDFVWLSFIRYTIVGLWVGWGAPWVFTKAT